jgi:hypothetical protein
MTKAETRTGADPIQTMMGSFPTGTNSAAMLTQMETWWSQAGACQHEMADFMLRRLEKDRDAVRDTLACKNWPDVVAAQSRWVNETMRDYTAEATRMLAISTGQVAESVQNRQVRPKA